MKGGIEKRKVAAVSSSMRNLEGPEEKKKCLLMSTAMLVLLCEAPVWTDAVNISH